MSLLFSAGSRAGCCYPWASRLWGQGCSSLWARTGRVRCFRLRPCRKSSSSPPWCPPGAPRTCLAPGSSTGSCCGCCCCCESCRSCASFSGSRNGSWLRLRLRARPSLLWGGMRHRWMDSTFENSSQCDSLGCPVFWGSREREKQYLYSQLNGMDRRWWRRPDQIKHIKLKNLVKWKRLKRKKKKTIVTPSRRFPDGSCLALTSRERGKLQHLYNFSGQKIIFPFLLH